MQDFKFTYMWILLGFNVVKCNCELYSRSVNLFPSAKLPSHLKVFQLWGRWRSGNPKRNCTHVYVYTYTVLKYPRISKCVAAMTKVKIFYNRIMTQLFWLASVMGSILNSQAFYLICLFVFNCWCMKHFGKGTLSGVHALDLKRGNISSAHSSALSGSVWGQIYWADLVFQYTVAAGHRSPTSDFLQNQSLLTFVKLMKMFRMLKCWFFQQHLSNQIKRVIKVFSCFLNSSRPE